MRVLFIHHGTILGGAPLSLLYLVRELRQRKRIEITIVCHSAEMRQFFSKHLDVPVLTWPDPLSIIGRVFTGWTPLRSAATWAAFLRALWFLPKSVRDQARLIEDFNPDVVHLNSATLFTAAIAARIADVPVVCHDRECLQGGFWNIRRHVCGWTLRFLADRVIAISPSEAQRLGTDRHDKVRIIYNPIDTDRLQPEKFDQAKEKLKLGVSHMDKVVLSLGGVNPRKGTCEIIDAMKYVDATSKLVIAGPPLGENNSPGTYSARIRELLTSLPEDKVIFTGIVEDVASLLAACDLLVFAGMTPHFPRPVLEAWMMEKPVIVFEMDGVSTLIENEVDGLVVKERTGIALGQAIRKLLEQPETMRRFGETGRRKAMTLGDPRRHSERILATYYEIQAQTCS